MTANNIYPDWKGTHEFTIRNTSNRTVVYNVKLINVTNTFTSNNLVYSLVKDGQTLVSSTPTVKSDATIANNIVIAPGETATFQINYEFLEIGSAQDYDQGKTYKSTVEIEIVSAI